MYIRAGSGWIDLEGGTVHRHSRIIPLTPTEHRLLAALAAQDPPRMTRAALLEEVWGYAATVRSHTVKTTIARLRRKLADGGAVLETLRGAGGYALQVATTPAPPAGAVAFACLTTPWSGHSERAWRAWLEAVLPTDIAGFAFVDEPGLLLLAFETTEAAGAWAAALQATPDSHPPPAVGIVAAEGTPPVYDGPGPGQAIQLARMTAPGRVQHQTAAPVPSARPTPQWQTGWVGRRSDLDRIAQLMQEGVRLITVCGPGGVGKTRLAVTAAGSSAVFCDLSPVRSEAELIAVVATALGLALPVTPAQLDRVIASRSGTLLLDNAEGCIALIRPAISRWLAAAGMPLLVTSRIRLGLDGEWLHDLPPLPAAEARRLLQQRVRAGQGEDLPDSPALGALVEALDRLPLALELAAGHIGLFGVDGLHAALQDRFALLKRDGHRPHDALQTVLDCSWALLPEAEQGVLAALSLFVGDFSAADAAALLPSASPLGALQKVQTLVRHSLLQARSGRLSMLQSVRDYARSRLAVSPQRAEAAQQHARWAVARAVALGHTEQTSPTLKSCVTLNRHLPELLAAAQREAAPAALLLDGLEATATAAARTVSADYIAAVAMLAAEGQPPATRARALCLLGTTRPPEDRQGLAELRLARALAEQVGDARTAARAAWHCAGQHPSLGSAEMIAEAEESLELLAEAGLERELVLCLLWLAPFYGNDNPEAGMDLLARAAGHLHRLRSPLLRARLTLCRGILRVMAQQFTDAMLDLDTAARAVVALDAFHLQSRVAHMQGVCALALGDGDRALQHFQTARAIRTDFGLEPLPQQTLYLGRALLFTGDLPGAARCFSEVRDHPRSPWISRREADGGLGAVAELRGDLHTAARTYRGLLQALRADGSRMTVACYHQQQLAAVLAEQGAVAEAEQLLQETGRIVTEVPRHELRTHQQLAQARLLLAQGQRAAAREILARFELEPASGMVSWLQVLLLRRALTSR